MYALSLRDALRISLRLDRAAGRWERFPVFRVGLRSSAIRSRLLPLLRARVRGSGQGCPLYTNQSSGRFTNSRFPVSVSSAQGAGPPFLGALSSFPITKRGCPILAFFARVGRDAADSIMLVMPRGLHRYYGAGHLHFITCSCYRRLPLLRSARNRDRLLSVLEQTRKRYRFVVVGYGVMPEHIHLLLSEPEVGTPSTVMQVLKQRTTRALLPTTERCDTRQIKLLWETPARAPFWQTRFSAFNVL